MNVKLLIAMFGVLMLAGCAKQSQAPTAISPVAPVVSPAPLTDAQKIHLLRVLAHARHLHWKVICAEDYFLGIAEPAGSENAIYIEDGAKPWWGQRGDTQANAALNLYQSLINNNAPNHYPDHRPGAPQRSGKMCPVEISGN